MQLQNLIMNWIMYSMYVFPEVKNNLLLQFF